MIRKLSKNEYELVLGLARTLKTSFTSHEFATNDDILVYEENSLILGFVCYSRMYETVDILYIVVDPGYRRKGIATKLIDELIKIEGIEHLMLEVSEENTGAIDFYKHLGFKPIREIKNYYGNTNALAMERVIK